MKGISPLLFVFWSFLVLLSLPACVILEKKIGNGIYFAFYTAFTILANMTTSKLVSIGRFVVPVAIVSYSVTFTLTDFTGEIFGKEFSEKIVLAAFFMNILVALALFISVKLPCAKVMVDICTDFNKVNSLSFRIFMASIITFIISQSHDVFAFEFWKKRTKGKYLWLRNNASTLVSQLIDSVCFCTLSFAFVMPWRFVFSIILAQYVIKASFAILDTPFLYISVWVRKKLINGE